MSLKNDPRTAWFIENLFDEGERVCSGNLFENKVTLVENLESKEFFCINPLTSVDVHYNKNGTEKQLAKRRYMKPRRADINVSSFRSFLFEMDSIPLINQLEILCNCGIPFSTIVYSGGKSYHAILSLETPLDGCHTENGIDAYKHIWKRLEAKIEKYANELGFNKVVDPSSKNPSRFSRFPLYKADDREEQKLISVGQRLSEDNFNSLLLTCPEVKIQERTEKVDVEVQDEEEFWKMCPDQLALKIKHPMNVAESGNYPELYKVCLWCQDTTGLSKELMIQLCERYLFPVYEKVGYPKSKWFNAINDAFRGA